MTFFHDVDGSIPILYKRRTRSRSLSGGTFEPSELETLGLYLAQSTYRRIAVQFSDHLFNAGQEVMRLLQSLILTSATGQTESRCLLWLADTSSEATCCVDEVAAKHYVADCHIHLGKGCQSEGGRTSVPTYRIYPRATAPLSVNFDHLRQRLQECPAVLVVYSVEHHANMGGFLRNLKSRLLPSTHLLVAIARRSDGFPFSPEVCASAFCNRRVFEVKSCNEVHSIDDSAMAGWLALSKVKILYIGATPGIVGTNIEDSLLRWVLLERAALNEIVLISSTGDIVAEDEVSSAFRSLIAARYRSIERCTGVRTVGLVLASVSNSSLRRLHGLLREQCRRANVRPLTILMGKLNVAKFENFPSVDVFCLLHCPHAQFAECSSDVSRPILTPFELQIALGFRDWTTQYLLTTATLMNCPMKLRAPVTSDEPDTSEKENDETLVFRETSLASSQRTFLENDLTRLSSRTFQVSSNDQFHNRMSHPSPKCILRGYLRGLGSRHGEKRALYAMVSRGLPRSTVVRLASRGFR